jgi:hypothetical protein
MIDTPHHQDSVMVNDCVRATRRLFGGRLAGAMMFQLVLRGLGAITGCRHAPRILLTSGQVRTPRGICKNLATKAGIILST